MLWSVPAWQRAAENTKSHSPARLRAGTMRAGLITFTSGETDDHRSNRLDPAHGRHPRRSHRSHGSAGRAARPRGPASLHPDLRARACTTSSSWPPAGSRPWTASWAGATSSAWWARCGWPGAALSHPRRPPRGPVRPRSGSTARWRYATRTTSCSASSPSRRRTSGIARRPRSRCWARATCATPSWARCSAGATSTCRAGSACSRSRRATTSATCGSPRRRRARGSRT